MMNFCFPGSAIVGLTGDDTEDAFGIWIVLLLPDKHDKDNNDNQHSFFRFRVEAGTASPWGEGIVKNLRD
jgi:hypothetical protein